MKMTIWRVSGSSPVGEAAGRALREAGIGLLEKDDWDEVTAALRRGEAALVVADAEAVSDLAARSARPHASLAPELAREISHELRTPLSAMAGWLHLMESGTLDAVGLKRAIAKVQGSIDDQVRTIEKYLGSAQEERH
jgi:signal transduction histidine kinase